jgi:hypothetical protein
MAQALKNQEAGSGSAFDAYFNNISVVPEPTIASMIAVGAVFMLRLRRKV